LDKDKYHTDKSELRKLYLEKRRILTHSEYLFRNKKILSYIQKDFVFSTKKLVHIFLPIEKFKEIDTWKIIDFLKSKNQSIVLSKSKLSTNDMTHFLYNEHTNLRENKWGIVEPESGIEIDEQKLDIVFVPLLVFDKSGNRIGYGKGYYDKFLSKCRPDCMKIGLSLMPPIDSLLIMSPLDVPLNYCVSPIGVYKF
jgi:5-formyltetrahydrofolate cyclo-ligase